MSLRVIVVAAVFTIVASGPTAADGKAAPKKSEDVVKVKARAEKPAADGTQVVTVTLTIEKPWHLYANPVGNDDLTSSQTVLTITGPDQPKTEKTEYPKGKPVKDATVGDYNVYEGEVTIKATVKRSAGAKAPPDVKVRLQACSEKTCFPPATVKVAVEVP